MTKVKKVKFLRMATIFGCIIACYIARTVPQNNLLGAFLMTPVTLLSGICALMYHQLKKKDKEEIYKLSLLHLYTIVMYPYFLFAGILFLNILFIISPLKF